MPLAYNDYFFGRYSMKNIHHFKSPFQQVLEMDFLFNSVSDYIKYTPKKLFLNATIFLIKESEKNDSN